MRIKDQRHFRIPKGISPADDCVSPMEYAFGKARFIAWAYLMREYYKLGVLTRDKEEALASGNHLSGKDLIKVNLELFILAAEYRIEFRSDRQSQKILKRKFAELIPSKFLHFLT